MIRLPYHREAWIAASGLFLLYTIFVLLLYQTALKTDFQRACEADGNFWLQSVPMRNGQSLSAMTVTGCTLGVGLHHFADFREYEHFVRPRESSAALAVQNATADRPADMTLHIVDGESLPVTDLTLEHDRYVHVLVIGEDLETFAHIHPEDLGPVTQEMLEAGRFPISFNFPKGGRYAVVVDYVVGAKLFTEIFDVEVQGYPLMSPPASLQPTRIATAGPYTVEMQAPRLRDDELQRVSFKILMDGNPVTDLEPYLAAPMHILIVEDTLESAVHTHGEYLPFGSSYFTLKPSSYHSHFVPASFGPNVRAWVRFPTRGTYLIFAEFKHRGEVHRVRFVVEV